MSHDPAGEYAILLLKPDGAADAGVGSVLERLLVEHGLSIEARALCCLLPAGVAVVTHRSDAHYADYLLSGPVEVLLLYGPDALEQALLIKRKIRAHFHRSTRVDNLIHAADPGNEMAGMLRAFFPEFAVPLRIGAADQYWVPDDLDHLQHGLLLARRQHPVGTVIPVLQKEVVDLDRTAAILSRCESSWIAVDTGRSLTVCGLTAEVLLYCRVAANGSREAEGVPALGYVGEELPDFTCVMQAARDAQLEVALCYHPSYSLQKVDRLEDAASAANLLALAGSGKAPAPFVLANSGHYMKLLEGVHPSRPERRK